MGRPRKQPLASQRMFIATESFATKVDGVDQSIVAGSTRVWEGHELIERFPNWFKPITAHYGVEQATAAPGEVRGE
jgi:hypothetical protein